MDEQLQEIYDNAKKAEACEDGLEWLTQFETIKEAEKDKKAPNYFYWYASNVIRGRWELGEKAISKDSFCSYQYAFEIEDRFELGEEVISKHADWSYWYARDVIKTRFELGEKAILNSTYKDQYEKLLDEISTFDQERV